MLDNFLEEQENQKDNAEFKISHEAIFQIFTGIAVAGIDTSSQTAAFAIYNLGKYPETKVLL